jgi:hypothetical protein
VGQRELEADDLISGWIWNHPDDHHVIVSSDTDFYQLLAPNVQQYNGVADELHTLEGIFDKKGKLVIDKKHTGSTLYDWEIVSGSTFAMDQKSQQENLAAMMQMFTNPQTAQFLLTALQNEGYEIKIGEMLKKIISTSGIQDWDKILVEKTEEEKIDDTLNMHAQQFQQAMMQGGMNQVPAQPGAPAQPAQPYGQEAGNQAGVL